MTPRQLTAAFIEDSGPRQDRIRPSLFYRPALAEYAARAWRVPALLARAAAGYAFGRRSWLAAAELLGQALPVGLFTNEPLRARVHEVFSAPGRSDDFRALARRLVVVATDLDSGSAAPFGKPGWDAVPISRAVAASAALPGLFPPVAIDGLGGQKGRRWYVDGALKKTLHARVLLDMDMDLVLCLNPLVPFDATQTASGSGPGGTPHRHHRVLGRGRIPHLVRGGLPVVLSQTFRTLIHSRLELGMKGYEASHPDTDIVLFEPDQRDPELFVANLFSYAQRRLLAEHAYQRTRADLRSRRSSLRPLLARHGLRLDDAMLDDPTRRLLRQSSRAAPAGAWGVLEGLAEAALALTPVARSAATLQRLDEVLVDLQRLLPRT
jgi:predicted acylesterase/phospholipase RssA